MSYHSWWCNLVRTVRGHYSSCSVIHLCYLISLCLPDHSCFQQSFDWFQDHSFDWQMAYPHCHSAAYLRSCWFVPAWCMVLSQCCRSVSYRTRFHPNCWPCQYCWCRNRHCWRSFLTLTFHWAGFQRCNSQSSLRKTGPRSPPVWLVLMLEDEATAYQTY